ncbi:MAG TPA: cysteine peptidase family C39 domain-containing protein, partial [Candidatus Obscuribacter sp.]|nr:cysteine peptidase family C39 domain-containing protein [Candidatus Obscuribacter sp.]
MPEEASHSCSSHSHNENEPPGSQSKATVQTGLICLQIVAQVRNISFDVRALSREFAVGPKELAIHELIRIARSAGLKASAKQLKVAKIVEKYPLPVIFQTAEEQYGLILSADKVKKVALVLMPGQMKPTEVKLDELKGLCPGKFIVIGQAL